MIPPDLMIGAAFKVATTDARDLGDLGVNHNRFGQMGHLAQWAVKPTGV
jgi:hypothetical protein